MARPSSCSVHTSWRACCVTHAAASVHSATRQMDPTCANLEKEEHIQRLQPQRFHRKEITGQQLMLMLT